MDTASSFLRTFLCVFAALVLSICLLCGGCLMLTQPITPEAKRAARQTADRSDRERERLKQEIDRLSAEPSSTSTLSLRREPTDEQMRAQYLQSLGLDPTIRYPYFPLVYGELQGSGGAFGATITGIVRNYSDQRFRYVSITFGLYDSWGNKVGNAYDNLSGLGPWETWRFKAVGFSEYSRFRIESLEGY